MTKIISSHIVCKKRLLTYAVFFAFITTPIHVAIASGQEGTLSTQEEFQDKLVDPLKMANVTYVNYETVTNALRQLFMPKNNSQTPYVISGSDRVLAFDLDVEPKAGNVLNNATNLEVNGPLKIDHLETFSLLIGSSQTGTQYVNTFNGYGANIIVGQGGDLSISKTVSHLLANSRTGASLNQNGQKPSFSSVNLLVGSGGTLSIESPIVELRTAYADKAENVLVSGTGRIDFGSAVTPLNKLHLQGHKLETAHNSISFGLHTISTENRAKITIHTKSFDTSLVKNPVYVNGGSIVLGSEMAPIGSFVTKNATIGMIVNSSGEIQGNIDAQTITFNPDSDTGILSNKKELIKGFGIQAHNGGTIHLAYGTGLNKGLNILGNKSTEVGIMLSYDGQATGTPSPTNRVFITKGDVSITGVQEAIRVDIPNDKYVNGQYRSTLELNVNHLTVDTTYEQNKRGTFLVNHEGDVTINANELEAVGDIINYGGTIKINENRDKAVRLRGDLYARKFLSFRPDVPTTFLQLGTEDSYLIGNVDDAYSTSKGFATHTTLVLRNNATWYGTRQYKTYKEIGVLKALKLDQGRVELGSEDPTIDVLGYNDKTDDGTSTWSKSHLKIGELNDPSSSTTGGTFVFRVNLIGAEMEREAPDYERYLTKKSDNLIILEKSYGNHQVMISDAGKKALADYWPFLTEEAYALLIVDKSTNREATFTIDPAVNIGKLYPLTAKMTDVAPSPELRYVDVPPHSPDERNWYLTLEMKQPEPEPKPSVNGRVHQVFCDNI